MNMTDLLSENDAMVDYVSTLFQDICTGIVAIR